MGTIRIFRHYGDGSITVSFTFKPGTSMMASERKLQDAANTALSEATGECLARFDTDGSPVMLGGLKFTSKGKLSKIYQTPYGEVSVRRHVYQSNKGGATFCPLEQDARIIRTSTPLFARQMAAKYANTNSSVSVRDFAEHGRKVARSYVMEVASDVALLVAQKDDVWSYAVAEAPRGKRVATVAVGSDGTTMLMNQDGGWRQVMVGTFALYDQNGERLHTTYVAAAPEYGKKTFYEKMDLELGAIKDVYPDVRYVGVADGAPDNWKWLGENTTWQVLDFWHVTEYLHEASSAMALGEPSQEAWAQDACHRLKHNRGAAKKLLKEMKASLEAGVRRKAPREALQKAITYFTNTLHMMDYSFYRAMDLPIGSGVTEAGCKCIAKARMCASGMRWLAKGAKEVLSLRAMAKIDGRWDEFWDKISRYGFLKVTAPKRSKT